MEQKNLILAIVLSAIVIIGWGVFQAFFFPAPPAPPAQQVASTPAQTPPAAATPGTSGATGSVPGTTATTPAVELVDREAALKQTPRIPIDSPQLRGSIALKGGRLDDVVLAQYRETVDPKSKNIVLLSPKGAVDAYFVELGWVGQGTKAPDDNTVWQADGDKLTVGRPLTLTWDNGEGVRFRRIFSLDQDFMFTVDQTVENTGTTPIDVHPFGRINRTGTPVTGLTRILQEGPIGAFGGTADDAKYRVQEKQYHNLPEQYRKANIPSGSLDTSLPENTFQSVGGWLGMNDKYWLVALVPDAKQALQARYLWQQINATDVYQIDYAGTTVTVPPGGKTEAVANVFAGAKVIRILDRYSEELAANGGMKFFDHVVDFTGYIGAISDVLTLIARPLFDLLDLIYRVTGNFGVAIMVLTVLVKGALFPVANKSYRSMNKMKRLGPQMQELRTRFADDKARLNQEMMALYKKEKVNPAAGCLPLFIQMPVFLALYQVLYVTIEMRQAPFFGWIKDLSATDPTTVLNLFGLLPWSVPHDKLAFVHDWGLTFVGGETLAGLFSLLNIGVWPLVLGVTMLLQQKMNPPPPDPVQAKIMTFLPIMFTFMMAQFQAGLVIYWSWNNLLSIGQQWLIKRLDERSNKQGPKPPEQKAEKQLEHKPEKRLERRSGKRN